MTKSDGDSRSPCFKPRVLLKNTVGLPFIRTENFTIDTHQQIHNCHLFPKPHLPRRSRRKSQLRWSYAFSISSLQIIPALSAFNLLSKHSFEIRTSSKMCLSLTKAFWSFEIIFPTTLLRRFVSTLEIIFYTPFTRLMGWNSLISTAPTFFGINARKVIRLFSNFSAE
ncbi:hypothetical protein I3843_04G125100 [Carya illinoinensis]|nr:hypothetical protein I3843_04G125100 [Carya illinoinensis]